MLLTPLLSASPLAVPPLALEQQHLLKYRHQQQQQQVLHHHNQEHQQHHQLQEEHRTEQLVRSQYKANANDLRHTDETTKLIVNNYRNRRVKQQYINPESLTKTDKSSNPWNLMEMSHRSSINSNNLNPLISNDGIIKHQPSIENGKKFNLSSISAIDANRTYESFHLLFKEDETGLHPITNITFKEFVNYNDRLIRNSSITGGNPLYPTLTTSSVINNKLVNVSNNNQLLNNRSILISALTTPFPYIGNGDVLSVDKILSNNRNSVSRYPSKTTESESVKIGKSKNQSGEFINSKLTNLQSATVNGLNSQQLPSNIIIERKDSILKSYGYVLAVIGLLAAGAFISIIFGIVRCLRATRQASRGLNVSIPLLPEDPSAVNAEPPVHPVPMLSVQTPGCAGMERLGVPTRNSLNSSPDDRGHINRRVLHHGDTSSLLPEQMKTTVTTSSSTLHHHDRHYNNMNNYSHHLSNNVNNCPQHVSLPDSEWGTDRNLFNSNSYQNSSELTRSYIKPPPNKTAPKEIYHGFPSSSSASNLAHNHGGSTHNVQKTKTNTFSKIFQHFLNSPKSPDSPSRKGGYQNTSHHNSHRNQTSSPAAVCLNQPQLNGINCHSTGNLAISLSSSTSLSSTSCSSASFSKNSPSVIINYETSTNHHHNTTVSSTNGGGCGSGGGSSCSTNNVNSNDERRHPSVGSHQHSHSSGGCGGTTGGNGSGSTNSTSNGEV